MSVRVAVEFSIGFEDGWVRVVRLPLAWAAAIKVVAENQKPDSGHSVGAFSGDAAAQQTEKGASCFDNGCAGCEQCTDYE